MTKRRPYAPLIASITVAACVIFGVVLVRAAVHPSTEAGAVEIPSPVRQIPNAEETSGTTTGHDPGKAPVQLIIPSINVIADVQHVGIAASGNMAVPSSFRKVGWYRLGAFPGEEGNVVMAGHVDNALSLPGVFYRLEELELGREIFVETEDGTQYEYIVSDSRWYNYKDVPAETVFNEGGAARLRLITCGGGWIQSLKTYDKRLVVTAVLHK